MARQGMKASPWSALSRDLGASRVVVHTEHPDFKITVTVVRPWIVGVPTTWEAHLSEMTSGLELSRRNILHRRDAEMWSWYHVVAAWPLLAEYRDLVQRQVAANLTQDALDDDERRLIVARIEKAAQRTANGDQADAVWWAGFESDLSSQSQEPA
jgi:hypothetical protein